MKYDIYKTTDNEDLHVVHLRVMTFVSGFMLVSVNYGESFSSIRHLEEKRIIYYVITLVKK
jgi:hypothetical protein